MPRPLLPSYALGRTLEGTREMSQDRHNDPHGHRKQARILVGCILAVPITYVVTDVPNYSTVMLTYLFWWIAITWAIGFLKKHG